MLYEGIKRRAIVPPVILEPAPDLRVEHAGYIIERLVAALWQLPASNLFSYGLACFLSNRRAEVDEEFPILRVLRASGTKRVPQKSKLLLRLRSSSIIILTIDVIKILDRLLVDTRCSLIRFYLFIR